MRLIAMLFIGVLGGYIGGHADDLPDMAIGLVLLFFSMQAVYAHGFNRGMEHVSKENK